MAFFIALLASLAVARGAIDKDVSAVHGRIEVFGFNQCKLEVNNAVLHYKGPEKATMPGVHFGLIHCICDYYDFHVISPIECMNCGIYCKYNELINGCEQTEFKGILSVIFGVILSVLITIVLTVMAMKYGHHFTDLCCFYYYRCKDRKEERKIKSYSKRFDVKASPSYQNPKYIKSDTLIGKLNNRRGTYIERNVDDIEIGELYDGNTKNSSEGNMYKNESKPSVSKNVLLTSALLLSNIDMSRACDFTMFLKSNNQICTNSGCMSMSMFSFPLMSGQTVCFKDSGLNVVEVYISRLQYQTRYNLMYYTSNFTIETESYWKCYGAGWCNPEQCKPNSRGDFTNHTIEGFGCHHIPTNCGQYCWHDSACAYFHWYLSPNGALFPVYEKSGRIWKADIVFKFKNITQVVSFHSNNPSKDVIGNFLPKYNKFPMIVKGFMTENIESKPYILKYYEDVYEVKASDKNFPQHELIGDYQVSTNRRSTTFSPTGVKCDTANCKTACSYKEPSIHRFTKESKHLKKVQEWTMGVDNGFIMTTTDVPGSIDMMIGNIDISNLQISTPDCLIQHVTTYACTACNEKSYLVFKSVNVKQAGVVPFESNCSFEVDYLSCNAEPYKLYLKDNFKSCMLYLPLFNKTFNINLLYSYKGDLDPMLYLHTQQSTVDSIRDVLTSSDFVQSLLNTTLYCTIAGTVLTVLGRLINIMLINRTAIKSLETK